MSTKNALSPASEPARVHSVVTELASHASRGCAGDLQFLPGARFKLGELIVELSHCLSMDRLVVHELESGFTRVVTRTDLRPIEKAPPEDATNRHPAAEDDGGESLLGRAARLQKPGK